MTSGKIEVNLMIAARQSLKPKRNKQLDHVPKSINDEVKLDLIAISLTS